MTVLVYGGSGSGKSAYAEQTACKLAGDGPLYYLATMRVCGAEGREKVKRHRRMRAGKGFRTLECGDGFTPVLRETGGTAVLLECLSNLTANLMFPGDAEEPKAAAAMAAEITEQVLLLAERAAHLVVVTNNVFEDGNVYDSGTMEYIRALSGVNRNLAERADIVVEVVAGIPVFLKGAGL